jgi:hypothetical protein
MKNGHSTFLGTLEAICGICKNERIPYKPSRKSEIPNPPRQNCWSLSYHQFYFLDHYVPLWSQNLSVFFSSEHAHLAPLSSPPSTTLKWTPSINLLCSPHLAMVLLVTGLLHILCRLFIESHNVTY